jgi:hypothetical protein
VTAVTAASKTRQQAPGPRSHRVNADDTGGCGALCFGAKALAHPSSRSRSVADLVFVGITVVLFAALAVLIRAVERW